METVPAVNLSEDVNLPAIQTHPYHKSGKGDPPFLTDVVRSCGKGGSAIPGMETLPADDLSEDVNLPAIQTHPYQLCESSVLYCT
jgi:hypothetical protein